MKVSYHMTLLNFDAETVSDISHEMNIESKKVESTLKLLVDECTIPFIARYRKEATGNLDEVQIRSIRDKFEYLQDLRERKESILRTIGEQGKLTAELESKIKQCRVKTELEDLYLPFKPKKRSRGQIAAEKGLVPLAEEILAQNASLTQLDSLFESFVGKHEGLKTHADVAQGVKDYIAEWISEQADLRKEIRKWTFENAAFKAEVRDEFKDKKTKFNNYYKFLEPVKSIASHRLMALRRGEKEEILKFSLEFDETVPLALISSQIIKAQASPAVKAFLSQCVEESYTRLISTGIETEIRLESKTFAEEEAITVFGRNLRNLLLLPPIPKRVVMGIDPGLRTGSKIVVVDKTGKLLDHGTIFPHHDQPIEFPKNKSASESILNFIRKHGVSLISIGNGTAGREMESFVEKLLEQQKELTVRVVMVNESGASVYSASDLAREEFPELDITYRGSVSIARRLQDPLAELVKIDPKSIGVGQYQHDVNQGRLKKQLGEVVESCVNYVGVNLNTASPSLLAYVAGIGPSLAKGVVRQRETIGEFKSRDELLNISGFGPKAFEQAAGFLRIADAANPLDNTGVHPEAYSVIEKMAESLSLSVKDLVGNKEHVSKIKLDGFVTEQIGLPTLQDILKELFKPGRDPREDGARHSYNREVRDFSQLKEGQILTGTVTNVTNFGAFVDIGVHQDGLIHISEISNQFVKEVAKAVSVGDAVKVKVIGLDKERKRISLSKKACDTDAAPAIQGAQTQRREPAQQQQRSETSAQPQNRSGKQYVEKRPQNFLSGEKGVLKNKGAQEAQGPSSMEDLLSKFNLNRV